MESHRKVLVDHLGGTLGELGKGLEYLKQHKPWMDEDDVQRAKAQYEKLRDILLGIDKGVTKTPTCEPSC